MAHGDSVEDREGACAQIPGIRTPARTLRTGEPILVPEVTDAMLEARVRAARSISRRLRELGVRSYMSVPLRVGNRTLGVLSFVAGESGRRYDAFDLQFAKDLAARAAMAVENARAYEEARRANRLKDEFLATLSHELRTPLNAILGYARMLKSGMVSPVRLPRAVEIIHKNAAALTKIVEDVLDVSRIVSGKLRLKTQTLDLAPVARGQRRNRAARRRSERHCPARGDGAGPGTCRPAIRIGCSR